MDIPSVTIPTLFTAFCAPVVHEATNYDQLELLGDAFLKFASSIDMYITYPAAPEGELTSRRTAVISNHQLYQKALDHGRIQILFIIFFVVVNKVSVRL